MSKKHKKALQGLEISSAVLSHAEEYRIIRHDLLKVIFLNAIYLACVLGIYVVNSKNGFLEKWFDKILHF